MPAAFLWIDNSSQKVISPPPCVCFVYSSHRQALDHSEKLKNSTPCDRGRDAGLEVLRRDTALRRTLVDIILHQPDGRLGFLRRAGHLSCHAPDEFVPDIDNFGTRTNESRVRVGKKLGRDRQHLSKIKGAHECRPSKSLAARNSKFYFSKGGLSRPGPYNAGLR